MTERLDEFGKVGTILNKFERLWTILNKFQRFQLNFMNAMVPLSSELIAKSVLLSRSATNPKCDWNFMSQGVASPLASMVARELKKKSARSNIGFKRELIYS